MSLKVRGSEKMELLMSVRPPLAQLDTQDTSAMTNKQQRRGAAFLLKVLSSEGAQYVFGNPGTTELPLIDALVDATDISYVWALQEASAVSMADGYARAAGRPGVLNHHTAGGLGHGLGNLLNASVSGTPQVPNRTHATF
jgi:benzoylformate decarboxylase